MRRPVLVAVALLLACAPRAGAAVPDPTAMGPLAYDQITYDAGPMVVSDPGGLSYPQEVTGSMWIPQAAGPFPVILLLHGHHSTCAYAGVELVGSPCPDTPATNDVRSYEGYDYLARNLASHGYLTLSLDANGINTYDQVGDKGGAERAQLLAHTLDLLGDWDRGPGPGEVGGRLVDRVDLTRVGMMGHSRGGGGVTNFVATYGPSHPGVKAVFDLAGTDYQTPVVRNVALAALLPLCDGDVYDLQSAFTWDRSRFAGGARVQFAVRGADHDFFNTVWTNDDYGGTDPACDPASPASVRLTPPAQRRVGLALMAAFLRRYVGPEPAFEALMTGSKRLDGVQTSYLAPAPQRRMLVTPRADAHALDETDDGAALTEKGLAAWSFCDPRADSGADGGNRDPGTNSGCPTNPDRSRARQLTVAWDGPAVVRALVAGDVTRFAALTFRVGVNFADTARNPASRRPVFDVVLEDAAGHRAAVHAGDYSNAFDPPAGAADRELTLSGVRIPLRAFAGVDLRRVRAVELRLGTPTAPRGSVQLAELALQS